MKTVQRSLFKFSPIATAIAVALAVQFPAQLAHANSGFGDGVDLAGVPVKLPTFNANSPSGLLPTLTPSGNPLQPAGMVTLNPTTKLPTKASSGKALRKFVDTLPGIGAAKKNNLNQYIPVAVTEKWVDLNGKLTTDDYIEIAAVEYAQKMHSDLLNATHLRGYVQLMTPGLVAKGVVAKSFTTLDGQILSVVDLPHHLGPVITATKDTALRVKFLNKLPVGGQLFIPVDTTVTGAGVGPDGVTPYSQNRAVMHLVSGGLPWISAGTPHQWIAPAGETNPGLVSAPVAGVVQTEVANAAIPAQTDTLLSWPASVGAANYTVTVKAVAQTLNALTLTLPNTVGAVVTVAANGLPGAQVDARGVSNNNVPDMADPGPGATTLYFPNDMSARFMFYHDRTSGMTRLNAYAGMEAGYFVTDAAEQALIAGGTLTGGALPLAGVVIPAGVIPGPADTIPLIIEDKTFVPADIAQQDAKWNKPAAPAAAVAVWGKESDLWFPHVYEPNQDPNSAVGTNPVGRFDFGPLFWPIFPAVDPLPAGDFGDATIVPEAFMDTPVVNGTAYPTLTVDPKTYRFRILNASVDRYLNLGLYKAAPDFQDAPLNTIPTAPQLDPNGNPILNAAGAPQFFSGTEVKLVSALSDALGNPPVPANSNGVPAGVVGGVVLYNPAGLAYDALCLCQYPGLPQNVNAAASGPTRAWPTDARRGGVPDPLSVGPDIIAIGNDGGFLPAPVDIPSQPMLYEQNRRSITVNNAYGYGLLLGPAERSDALIDFSAYAGQTLIVYNDAPAPFPFSDERNDYYTGGPDMTGVGGAYPTKPGYGPNTRTVMQIKVKAAAPAAAYNPAALLDALPKAYAATQPAPLVPAVAYNKAFGTNDPDIYAHIATGAAAQPTLDFTTTGPAVLTLTLPTLITSGGTVNAAGVMVYNTGSGSGYDPASPPKVVFNNTVNGVSCLPVDAAGAIVAPAASASAKATVDANHQVSGIIDFVAGSGYTCLPTVSFVNTAPVTSIAVVAGGSGYTNPNVNFIGGDGTGASATAIVGKSVSVANPVGSGYSAPTVTVTGGGVAAGSISGTATVGTSAATVTVDTAGAGYVSPVVNYSGFGVGGTVLNGVGTVTLDGSGGIASIALDPAIAFIAAPSIVITETDLVAVATVTAASVTVSVGPTAGTITGVTLTPNAGFTSAPMVTISDPKLAAVTPAVTLAATGSVIGFTILNKGTGYSVAPTVEVNEGGNVSAKAIVGLAPTLGVGAQVAVQATGGNIQSLKILPVTEQELFDNRGRYNYTGGVEMPFTNAINQTTVPLNYIDAATEKIKDGETQVWKITVNGLFSNNLSFNMADVQLLNRVGWDGTVKPPSSNELGWKNTLRMNPLEDVVIAVRAKRASVPFGIPQSNRLRDPSRAKGALGSGMGFTVGQGVPQLTSLTNVTENYDNEFFWNSSKLSNSETDFMRPIVFQPTVFVPDTPTNLADPLGNGTLTWTDPTPAGQVAAPPAVAATLANPKNEIGFKILQASLDAGGNQSPLVQAVSATGAPVTVPANQTSWTQPLPVDPKRVYALVAFNAAGDSLPTAPFAQTIPVAPTVFTADFTPITTDAPTLVNFYNSVTLTWSGGTSSNKLELWRSTGGAAAVPITTLPGTATGYVDKTVTAVASYTYQIKAINAVQPVASGAAISAPLDVTTPMIPVTAPNTVTATTNNQGTAITVKWTDSANNETAYQVDVSVNGGAFAAVNANVPYTLTRTLVQGTAVAPVANVPNITLTPNFVSVPGNTYVFRVTAINVTGAATSTSAPTLSPLVDLTIPVLPAPTFTAGIQTATQAPFTWTAVAAPVTVPATAVSYVVQVNTNGAADPVTGALVWVNAAPTNTLAATRPIAANNTYQFRVVPRTTRFGVSVLGTPSTTLNVTTAPLVSTVPVATAGATPGSGITLTWSNASANSIPTSFTIDRRVGGVWVPIVPALVAASVEAVPGTPGAYSWTDTGLAAGSYRYRVLATNGTWSSAYTATSNTVTAP